MKTLFALSLKALMLTACATYEPPRIAYDSAEFKPAVLEPEPPRPVEVVEVAKPLPLPGQLKPIPERTTEEAEPVDPVEGLDGANDRARREPGKDHFVNAIQVFPYAEGALYRVYTAPGQVTDIALQPGENLVSVSAGDTVRWVVGDTTSGSGESQQVHILVKPFESGLTTNLMIATDRRTYHLELVSLESSYLAAVSWRYSRDQLIALGRRNERARAAAIEVADAGLDLQRLRFRYRVSGDDPPWKPGHVFDDGRKVYIAFPRGLSQGEAPPLFVVGPKGETQLVNYRVKGRYYIVDRLFAAAELRLGEDPQEVVRIVRMDVREEGS